MLVGGVVVDAEVLVFRAHGLVRAIHVGLDHHVDDLEFLIGFVLVHLLAHVLVDGVPAKQVHQVARRGLPLAVDLADLAFLVFQPRHVAQVPAAVQQAVAGLVQAACDHALAEGGPVVIALFRRLGEQGLGVVHGAAHDLGGSLHPAGGLIILALILGQAHGEPRLGGGAQHGTGLVAQISAAQQRIAAHQVAGVVGAQAAVVGEVSALGVEVLRGFLPEQQQARAFGEQAHANFPRFFCFHQAPPISRPAARLGVMMLPYSGAASFCATCCR